jgi:hypothetical protein
MDLYLILLTLHNWTRWLVVIAGLVALVMALIGWFGRKEWMKSDRLAGLVFSIILDIQFLIGLTLYFLSPFGSRGLADMGAMMANQEMRFFGLEHVFYMLLAVIVTHVGASLARRAENSLSKFRRAAIWYAVALVILAVGIPWWRPLLRV